MDNNDDNGRGFLKELAADAILTATIMNQPVYGSQDIVRVVETVATFYAKKTPLFQGRIGGLELVGYKADLVSGEEVHGLISITRLPDGLIWEINVSYSPLPGVLALSRSVARELNKDFPGTFLGAE